MSPLLFNVYNADNNLEKKRIGGIELGRDWSLTCGWLNFGG